MSWDGYAPTGVFVVGQECRWDGKVWRVLSVDVGAGDTCDFVRFERI